MYSSYITDKFRVLYITLFNREGNWGLYKANSPITLVGLGRPLWPSSAQHTSARCVHAGYYKTSSATWTRFLSGILGTKSRVTVAYWASVLSRESLSTSGGAAHLWLDSIAQALSVFAEREVTEESLQEEMLSWGIQPPRKTGGLLPGWRWGSVL